jgi:hypothetical protein
MVTTLGQLARDRRQPVEVFDAAMVRRADRGSAANGEVVDDGTGASTGTGE